MLRGFRRGFAFVITEAIGLDHFVVHLARGESLLDVTNAVVLVGCVNDGGAITRIAISVDVKCAWQAHDTGWVFKRAISVSVIE